MKPIVVFDLETTGLDKTKDSIIQFAAIKMDRETNKLIDSLNLYIQPEGSYNISIQAYFKHGITAKFLADKPYFKDVYKQILDFMEDSDILTYNGCNFDIPFLKSELFKVGVDKEFLGINCYDAFLEEKRRNGNKLGETYARYKGKTMEEAGLQAHDALSDVKATYSIFVAQQMREHYGPENIITEDNVLVLKDFQGKVVPCFSIGKYKDISVEFVKTIDMQYLAWCISDNCNFLDSTKEYIKNLMK